jgi:hypothetical protein
VYCPLFISLSQVLKPLETRYKTIVENPDLKNIYVNEDVRTAVIDLLESLMGVVQGCHVSTVHQVFNWMQPTVASLVHLLALYHNYSQVAMYLYHIWIDSEDGDRKRSNFMDAC